MVSTSSCGLHVSASPSFSRPSFFSS
jgi:hypothetical protein